MKVREDKERSGVVCMTKFTAVKIPKEGRESIRIVQAHLARHGTECLPEWLQEILLRGKRPLNAMNVACAGILVLVLLERGKSIEEIKRMSREEVGNLLKESHYPTEILGEYSKVNIPR